MKAGIIGLGQIGYKIDEDPNRALIWSHAKAYDMHPDIDLSSVSDINKNARKDFNINYKAVPFFEDYREMVRKNSYDIISICTPTQSHLEVLENIVEINPPRAFFVEKPLGSGTLEAKRISEICKEKGIVLAVNYMRRWDNQYKFIFDKINSQDLGILQTITVYGSTALQTSTSHLMDLLSYFGGPVEWLVGDLQEDYVRKSFGKLDPGGISFIKFKKGHHGFLKGTSKNDSNIMFEIDLLFSDGRIKVIEPWITNDESVIQVQSFLARNESHNSNYRRLITNKEIDFPSKNERMLEAISNIISCIDSSESPLSGAPNSILVHKIIKAIKHSSGSSNMKVYLDE